MIQRTYLSLFIVVLCASCAEDPEQIAYRTGTLENRDIVISVQAAGIVEPETTVEVKSKASGEVLELQTQTGDIVQPGTLLVQIDKRTPRNLLAQAEAELEAAKARRAIAQSQTERAQKLRESGTLNQVDLEQSLLEFANAKAEVVRADVTVENARISLEDTEVRAPVSGTILELTVAQGQVISSPTMDVGGGTLLMKMADLSSVQIRTLVDETDIGKLSDGLPATVTVTAFPNQPFDGVVSKIEPKSMDEQTVTMFPVMITLQNERGLLRPGMNADVGITIAARYDIPAIPTQALRTRGDITATSEYLGLDEGTVRAQLQAAKSIAPTAEGKESSGAAGDGYAFGASYWVFVLRNNEPTAVPVRTGLTDLDFSEIVSGLEPDDEVLILPSSGLIMSEQMFRKWMGKMGGVPGMGGGDKDKDKSKGKPK